MSVARAETAGEILPNGPLALRSAACRGKRKPTSRGR
jgi:hypothetical protein